MSRVRAAALLVIACGCGGPLEPAPPPQAPPATPTNQPCASTPPSYLILKVPPEIELEPYVARLLLSGFPTTICDSCRFEAKVGDQLGEAGRAAMDECGGSVLLRRMPSAGDKIQWRDRPYQDWQDLGITIQ